MGCKSSVEDSAINTKCVVTAAMPDFDGMNVEYYSDYVSLDQIATAIEGTPPGNKFKVTCKQPK